MSQHSDYMKRYNRTFVGFIKGKWSKMHQRVKGNNGQKDHNYVGLPILPKEAFYELAFASESLKLMFNEYEKSGWKYSLCPSVDRIDPLKGYTEDNIRFITMKENQDLGRKHQWRKKELA